MPVSAVRAAAAESTGLHYYDEAPAGPELTRATRERELLIASIDRADGRGYRRHVAALVESLRNRTSQEVRAGGASTACGLPSAGERAPQAGPPRPAASGPGASAPGRLRGPPLSSMRPVARSTPQLPRPAPQVETLRQDQGGGPQISLGSPLPAAARRPRRRACCMCQLPSLTGQPATIGQLAGSPNCSASSSGRDPPAAPGGRPGKTTWVLGVHGLQHVDRVVRLAVGDDDACRERPGPTLACCRGGSWRLLRPGSAVPSRVVAARPRRLGPAWRPGLRCARCPGPPSPLRRAVSGA